MRRHLFWIVEAFIWLLILVVVSGVFIISNYNDKRINTYQLFLTDVDGLIKGSPVKYMGIQIGYVSQINIVNDKVFLNFVITKKDTKLPKGVIATVEFSGLGGSKSLEIYPPEKWSKSSSKMIFEQPPKRIGDSLSLLNKMFGQIAEITYSISNFMDQLEVIAPQKRINQNNYKFGDKFLNVTNDWFDNSQKRLDNLSKKLFKGGSNGRYSSND